MVEDSQLESGVKMRAISWLAKGSKKNKYFCEIKILEKEKLIFWMDCACWNFVNRRLKSVGENADKKTYAEPCKHLKPTIESLQKLGYKLKKPNMEGPDKLITAVIREVVERSGRLCEVQGCEDNATRFHRIVRGSNGGKYTYENIRHICGYHHKEIHQNEFPGTKQNN